MAVTVAMLTRLLSNAKGLTLRDCEDLLGPGTYAAMAEAFDNALVYASSLPGDTTQDVSRGASLPNYAVRRTFTLTSLGRKFVAAQEAQADGA